MRNILIFVELIVIFSLLGYAIFLYVSPLQRISSAPIAVDSITRSASSTFEYYFEFEPGIRKNGTPSWLEGYELVNTTNADTLNERLNYSVEKPARTYRVVTLGDSWTYGQFVSTPDNFSEKLEDLLNTQLSCKNFNAFEVINLGVPNYDVAYAYERFKIRGEKYNPDTVVWLFIPNDFTEIQELFYPLSRSIYEELQQQTIDEAYDERQGYKGLRTSSGDIRAAMAALSAIEEIQSMYTFDEIRDYQETYLRAFLEQHDGGTVLYTVPDYLSYSREDVALLKQYANEFSAASYVPSEFQWTEGYHLPDQHPSPAGHSFLAQELFEYLLETELKECTVIS